MHSNWTQPIDFYDSFGGRVRIAPVEYFELLGDRGTQTYLACVTAILIATDAPGLLGHVSLIAALGIWVVVISAFLLSHGLVLLTFSALLRVTGRFVMPGAFITMTAMLLPLGLGDMLVRFSSHGTLSFLVFPQVVFYFIICETFVMIYMRYVRPDICVLPPQMATSLTPQPATPQTGETDRQILIGAEPVSLRTLRHIQAQEHHVHVVLDGASLTQRARLSDIVAQTAPEDGIQPHRSWWVARHVARTLERDGQKHVLCLDDGTRVPVARSRVTDVRDWLE